MKDYIIYVAGGQHNVTAEDRQAALAQLPASERPWVLDVVELDGAN